LSPISIHEETTSTATAAAAAIEDKKGLDVALLDVSRLLVITDIFVIATGTSRRHVLGLAEEVEAKLKDEERRPLRREGVEDATWVLLDYGDVVVHLFDAETRSYYDLERLWGDAPRVAYESAASQAAGS
jgi:ribosome-associated protein